MNQIDKYINNLVAKDKHAEEHAARETARSGYAPINGLDMYYEVHGAARNDSLPLVLLHGGGSDISLSFERTLPLFAGTRQVIAFDQQGHGRTADIADRSFSFEQSAADAISLLEYLDVEKADILGYSNGGHIALQIAISYPEMVRKLVLESVFFQREGISPDFWEGFNHASLDDMPEEFRTVYLNIAPHPENLPSFFAKSVERMKNFKGWIPDQIKSIEAPTLVLLGDRDIVTPEHAAYMCRLLSNAQLAILPDTDHMSIVNRSEWVPSMVETFLKSPTR